MPKACTQIFNSLIFLSILIRSKKLNNLGETKTTNMKDRLKTKTHKILFGGITGAIAFFFADRLIYGLLLAGFLNANFNQCAMRPVGEIAWSSLILSDLSWGFLLAIIFSWTNIRSWRDGAKRGALIGLFISLSIDFANHAMSTMYTHFGALFVDIAATTLLAAIGGAAIAAAMKTTK